MDQNKKVLSVFYLKKTLNYIMGETLMVKKYQALKGGG